MGVRATLLCAALAAALIAAGCGSSKPAPLTHRSFVKHANGDCHGAARALARIPQSGTPKQFERVVNRAGFVVQRLHDKLTTLHPPARDADRYKRFLVLLDGDLRAVHAVERAVLNQRYARLAGLENSRGTAAQRELHIARALRIPACAGVTTIDLPAPPKPRPQPATATTPAPTPTVPAAPPGLGKPLNASARTDFIAGCAVQASRSACVCVYGQLTRHFGIDTIGKLLRLADDTRRALLRGSPSALPPAVKGAAIGCRSKLGVGA